MGVEPYKRWTPFALLIDDLGQDPSFLVNPFANRLLECEFVVYYYDGIRVCLLPGEKPCDKLPGHLDLVFCHYALRAEWFRSGRSEPVFYFTRSVPPLFPRPGEMWIARGLLPRTKTVEVGQESVEYKVINLWPTEIDAILTWAQNPDRKVEDAPPILRIGKNEGEGQQLSQNNISDMVVWLACDGSPIVRAGDVMFALNPAEFRVLQALAKSRNGAHFGYLSAESLAEILDVEDRAKVAKAIGDVRAAINTKFFAATGIRIDPRRLIVTTEKYILPPGYSVASPLGAQQETSTFLGAEHTVGSHQTAYEIIGRRGPSVSADQVHREMRVLVVEKDTLQQIQVRNRLQSYGYKVTVADCEAEATSEAERFGADIVYVNLSPSSTNGDGVPWDEGLRILRVVKQKDPKAKTPVGTGSDGAVRSDLCDQMFTLGLRDSEIVTIGAGQDGEQELVQKLWRLETELKTASLIPFHAVPYLGYFTLRLHWDLVPIDKKLDQVLFFGQPFALADEQKVLLWLLARRPGFPVSEEEIFNVMYGGNKKNNALAQRVAELRSRIELELTQMTVQGNSEEISHMMVENAAKDGYQLNARVDVEYI